MTNSGKTKFEEDLKVYFPELSDLYALMKEDKRVWVVIKSMIDMFKGRKHGRVEITYQEGKINHIFQTENKDV